MSSRSRSTTAFSEAFSDDDDDLIMVLTHPPQILDPPAISHQKLHVATSILQITVYSTVRPQCTWLRMVGNGRETIRANMRRVQQAVVRTADDIYLCSLTIEKPNQRLDSGFYVCRVQNDGGTVEADFDFDCSEIEKLKPKATSDPRIWTMKSENGESEMHFELCFHSNHGPVEVIWDPPSSLKITDPKVRTTTVEEGNGNYKTQMDIVNFTEEHDGYFRCIVQNNAGELSHCFNPKFAEYIE